MMTGKKWLWAGISALFWSVTTGNALARDWEQIKASGFLVCAVNATRGGDDNALLSRRQTPEDCEQGLINAFAARNGITVYYREEPSFPALFSHLKEGRCDMVAAALTATPERADEFLLTIPFAHSTEQIVVSVRRRDLSGLNDLVVKKARGEILPGTSYLASMKDLSARHSLHYRPLTKTITQEELLDRVASGKTDYTLLDNGFVDSYLSYSPTVKVIYSSPSRKNLIWALPRSSPILRDRLNGFIRESLDSREYRNRTGDWASIRRRGYLRMITCNTAHCYYLKKGVVQGFEYELAKRFADENHLRLVVIVPPAFADMETWLREGKGDFIAANFTKTEERTKNMRGVRFCAPYAGATEMMVGRMNEKLRTEKDLSGRSVYVREATSYYESLQKMRAHGMKLTIHILPAVMDEFEKIARVESGEYDLTVTDDTFLRLAIEGRMRLKALFPVSEKNPYAWLVREGNPVLEEKINTFFQTHRKSAFYNILYKKYYAAEKKENAPSYLDAQNTRISNFDNFFQQYAKRYGMDWRLIASQSYQESRFDPNAKSPVGAVGLMQMLPSTAKELGFQNVLPPAEGIHAGSKYMRLQLDKYDASDVAEIDRVCFALASYNAGHGHIRDARKLAASSGLDPNRWSKNVETALKKLEQPRYASRARFGYCRAGETIPYVNDILLRFHDYRVLLEAAQKKKNLKKITHTP